MLHKNNQNQDKIIFKKRFKEEEEERTFNWLTIVLSNQLLQTSTTTNTSNGTEDSPRTNSSRGTYPTIRLRKQDQTDKQVTLYYKISRTTLHQLLRKLAKRVRLSDVAWRWDPLLYPPIPDDNRPCYGIYLHVSEDVQGIWIDRPDAVLSDWLIGNGVRSYLMFFFVFFFFF